MPKIRRKSGSVRAQRWYRTLQRELHILKPETEDWMKRIDKWAIRTKTKKNGEKIFCGAITREH